MSCYGTVSPTSCMSPLSPIRRVVVLPSSSVAPTTRALASAPLPILPSSARTPCLCNDFYTVLRSHPRVLVKFECIKIPLHASNWTCWKSRQVIHTFLAHSRSITRMVTTPSQPMPVRIVSRLSPLVLVAIHAHLTQNSPWGRSVSPEPTRAPSPDVRAPSPDVRAPSPDVRAHPDLRAPGIAGNPDFYSGLAPTERRPEVQRIEAW